MFEGVGQSLVIYLKRGSRERSRVLSNPECETLYVPTVLILTVAFSQAILPSSLGVSEELDLAESLTDLEHTTLAEVNDPTQLKATLDDAEDKLSEAYEKSKQKLESLRSKFFPGEAKKAEKDKKDDNKKEIKATENATNAIVVWRGTHNGTSVDEDNSERDIFRDPSKFGISAEDMIRIKKDNWLSSGHGQNCPTAALIGKEWNPKKSVKSQVGCTSCIPDKWSGLPNSLIMNAPVSRTGVCHSHKLKATVQCWDATKQNVFGQTILADDKLCTKLAMTLSLVDIRNLPGKQKQEIGNVATTHFPDYKGVKEGKKMFKKLIVRCMGRKETHCLKNKKGEESCQVKKQVLCHDVCPLQSKLWNVPGDVSGKAYTGKTLEWAKKMMKAVNPKGKFWYGYNHPDFNVKKCKAAPCKNKWISEVACANYAIGF